MKQSQIVFREFTNIKVANIARIILTMIVTMVETFISQEF